MMAFGLRIMGKGNKLRDVTLSEDFITYLKRYRLYRGLPALPRATNRSH